MEQVETVIQPIRPFNFDGTVYVVAYSSRRPYFMSLRLACLFDSKNMLTITNEMPVRANGNE